MQRSARHRRFLYASAALASAMLVATAMLAGCSCTPQPKEIATQVTASETATPAVETTPLPTEPTSTTEAPPAATGPVYSATSSSQHPEERKAILVGAHAYLGDSKPFVVNQIAIQQPYAIASLTTEGGRTWVVALKRTGSRWVGVWRGALASRSSKILTDAGVIDAPRLTAYFRWSMPAAPVTKSSAVAFIKTKLSGDNPDTKVKSVDIKVFEKDADGTVWVGAFIENNLDGGIVFAKKPAGKSWTIVDFGTGIDGSEMEGKAPAAIAAKFKAAFPQ